MMNSYYCPYLGKDGDSETAIGFAHASNRCFAGETPLAIKIDYQERFCLVPNHRSCNVYLQNPVSLPGESQPSSAPPTYDSNGLGDDSDVNPPTQPGNAGDSTQPVSLADTGPIPVEEPPQREVDYRRPAKAPREEPSKGFSLPEISFSETEVSKKGPPAEKKPRPEKAPISDKKSSERSENTIEEEARQNHLSPSPEKPSEEKTSSQNDHYEPGSIAPPRPKDGGKRQSPPRPGKIPGLESYGPQSYGPQSYGPQKNGNGQKRYGPGEDGKKPSKAERHQKSKGHQQSSKKTSDGTQPVNVKKSAPITSPRKRLNWLTILEVLMGIVVLGGIVLVIWLMISLIPGNTGSGLIFPPIIASTTTATDIDSEAVPPVLTETPQWTSTATTMPTLTPTEVFTATLTATSPPPTATATQPTQAPPEDCDIPESWVPYTVQSGDVLVNLAEFFGLTLQELQEGNCMEEETLIYPGDVIYLPDINEPTATPTEESES